MYLCVALLILGGTLSMKKTLLVALTVLALSVSAFANGKAALNPEVIREALQAAGMESRAIEAIAVAGRAEALLTMLNSGKLATAQVAKVLAAVEAKAGSKVSLDDMKASLTSIVAESATAQQGAIGLGNSMQDVSAIQGPNVATRLSGEQETDLLTSAQDISAATGGEVQTVSAEQIPCVNSEDLSNGAISNFVGYNKTAAQDVVKQVSEGKQVGEDEVATSLLNAYGEATDRDHSPNLTQEECDGGTFVATKCGKTGFHTTQVGTAMKRVCARAGYALAQ